jgi:hypothetical protein
MNIMRRKEVNWAVISLVGTYTLLKKEAMGVSVGGKRALMLCD